jgi:hypothetical protein
MEISCPQCNQRLRVPNEMKNPLLRCKKCGSSFRLDAAKSAANDQPVRDVSAPWYPPSTPVAGTPAETPWPVNSLPSQQAKSQQLVPEIEVVDEEPTNFGRNTTPTISEQTKSFASSGLGTIALIVVVILFKAGPRLAREFFRDRPQQQQQQQPVPVRIDPNRIDELRKRRQAFEQRLQQRQQFEIPAPDAAPN